MDGMTLLRRAHEAGLNVATEGDKLVIRGPRRAESVARLLIEHKPKVMAALTPSTTQRALEAVQPVAGVKNCRALGEPHESAMVAQSLRRSRRSSRARRQAPKILFMRRARTHIAD
jgi:hypothetical protein